MLFINSTRRVLDGLDVNLASKVALAGLPGNAPAPLGNPWVQMSDFYPGLDPVYVASNRMGVMIPPYDNGHPDEFVYPNPLAVFPEYPSSVDWGQFSTCNGVAFQSLGRTDNMEVGLSYYVEGWPGAFHQIGPAAFVNPEATDTTQLGVTVNSDISLFREVDAQIFYGQNIFAVPDPPGPGFNFDPTYYDGGHGTINWPYHVVGRIMTIRLFCVNGELRYSLSNGIETMLSDVWERPSWTDGIDGWGMRSLSLWVPENQPLPDKHFAKVAPAPEPSPDRIIAWWARPCTTMPS